VLCRRKVSRSWHPICALRRYKRRLRSVRESSNPRRFGACTAGRARIANQRRGDMHRQRTIGSTRGRAARLSDHRSPERLSYMSRPLQTVWPPRRLPRTSSAFQSTRGRVLDTTYFFFASIVRAKGSIQSGRVPAGTGRRHPSSISSNVTRPKRSASARSIFSAALRCRSSSGIITR
jgi:hypothetical protein